MSCPCRLHDRCTASQFRVQQREECPICKVDWTGNNFVGEKAVGRGASSQPQRRSNGNGRESTRRVTEFSRESTHTVVGNTRESTHTLVNEDEDDDLYS